jgi:YesN/AraC family two-component response regulator
MELSNKLDFFYDLISCNYDFYSWTYNNDHETLYSNCPNELLFNQIFTISGCKDYMFEYGKNNTLPLVLSDNLGLIWISVFETKDNELARIHVLGPVYTSNHSLENIQKSIKHHNLSIALQNEIIRQLQLIPTISLNNYFNYAIMLHYCITGEKIKVSDISYQLKNEYTSEDTKDLKHVGTWMTEQFLLKMVEDGNLNYKQAKDKAVSISSGVQMRVGDAIRQAKDSVIIFVALCVRAAIRGGLSPETAYTVGDYYIQNIELCTKITEIATISHTMYEDFIHRVHKCKTNTDISMPIQICRDYIDLHITDKLTLPDLATRVGYTEYYLSKKFKKEVGLSINEYIKNSKIAHAKIMLGSSNDSIQEISDSLNFCSRSYFTDTFQKVVGVSPSEYREKHLRL